MIRLLLATRNEGKLRELRHLVADLPINVFSLADFAQTHEVPETGSSFSENASLKAVGYALQTQMMTLADDSGLEVDALGGAPGIFSARYAGKDASDAQRTNKLLQELSGTEAGNRSARFVSAVAVASANGEILNLSTGSCEGRIDLTPSGNQGFGYDPVFIPNGYQQSFGALDPEIKNQISHRARALLGVRAYLLTLTIGSSDD